MVDDFYQLKFPLNVNIRLFIRHLKFGNSCMEKSKSDGNKCGTI